MPRPTTRLIALLGDPVSHSLSPTFQNAAIQTVGLDAVYLPLRCDGQQLAGLLRGIAGAGGAGNVTVPHKARAAELVDLPTGSVVRTGACNTFWSENGRIHGDNTDLQGCAAAMRQLLGSPAGARALVLGAGGAARAAVAALLDERADAVHVLNRTPARAESLRDMLDPRGRRVTVIEPGHVAREGYDLVINATPLGLRPDDSLPLDLDRPVRVGSVLDLTYAAGGTPFIRAARERGIAAADGVEMLLRQGAASFERWFGQPAPLDAMRASLDA